MKSNFRNLVSVAGVSIGLVLSILGLYWLRYESAYDTHIKNSERMFKTTYKNTTGNEFVADRFYYKTLIELYPRIPEIENFCQARRNNYGYTYPDQPDRELIIPLLEIDDRFLSMMDVQFVKGNKRNRLDPHTLLLTESTAKKIFGRTDVVQEVLSLNVNDVTSNFSVAGVIRDIPENSTIRYSALAPTNLNYRPESFYSYVLLHKASDKEKALATLNKTAIEKETDLYDLIPLRQAKYLISGVSFWKAYSPLIAIVASALLLLLCTFVNLYIVNLTKFMQRLRECIFHRQAGAVSRHIYGLLYMEIVFLSLFSFLFCFVVIELLAGPYYRITGISLNSSAFYCFAAKTGALFFVILLLSQVFAIRYINNLSRFTHGAANLVVKKTNRNILIVQLFISAFFLFNLSIVYLQFRHMIRTPTGFDSEQTVFVDLRYDQRLKKNSAALINDIKAGSMIVDAIAESFVIYDDRQQTISTNELKGLEGIDKSIQLGSITLSPAAPAFFGFQLVTGRFPAGGQTPAEVMLNQEAVKQLGLSDPIGKTFLQYDRFPCTFVGVIKDYVSRPLSSPTVPLMYDLYDPEHNGPPFTSYVKYKPGAREEALRFIDRVCERHAPGYNKNNVVKPMDLYIRSFYRKESTVLTILTFITLTCLLITVWGIAAMVVLALKRQRKSIAVRKIMGAGRYAILTMYLKRYGTTALTACAISFPASYLLARQWLDLYACRIRVDISVFAGVLALITGVTLVITSLLVNRAIGENPAEVVKENN